MKRILRLICTLVFVFSLCLLTGCNCEGNLSNKQPAPEQPPKTEQTEEIRTLERYSLLDLSGDFTKEEMVVWGSSNESVALVKNGIVFGVGGGSTEITATVGEKTSKYTVVVKATTSYMKLTLSQTEMQLLVGNKKSFSFALTDNKGTVIPEEFVSYELTISNSCVEVNEKTITATQEGETLITVFATCAEQTVVETLKVSVLENASICFDKTFVDGIYTNSLNGTLSTSEQLTVFVYENNQKIVAPSLTYKSSDNEVAEVSETGVVKGKKAGVATVVATYLTEKGKEISASITVSVACPVVSATEILKTEVFSDKNLTIDVSKYEEYFSEGMTAVSIFDDLQNYIPATLSQEKVTLENSKLSYGYRKLTITINDSISFVYDAEIATKYISTAEQLANFAKSYGGRDTTGTYEGYYILTNDIDMTGAKIDYDIGDENISSAVKDYLGFKGIFDGKGYTVYNANDNIFGKVSKDGVIKNTAFYSNNALKYGTVACLFAGRLENVYIHSNLSKITASHYSSIGYRTIGSASFKNVVVEVVGKADVVASTLIYDTVKFPPSVENVYVVSPSIDDPIVFKNGKVNGNVVHYALSTDRKDFSLLDKSSGYWQTGTDKYRFLTSNVYDLPILKAPDEKTFVMENGTLTWTAIDGASGYTVLVNGKEIVVSTNSYKGFNDGVIRIKANGTENLSRDSAYSEPYAHFELSGNALADFSNETYTGLVSPLDRYLEPEVSYLSGYKSVQDGVLKLELTTTTVDGNAWAGFSLKLPKTAPDGSKLKIKLYVECDYATGVYVCDSKMNRLTDGINKIDITAKGGWFEQTVDCTKYTSLDELIFRAYTSKPNRKVTIYLALIETVE